MDKTMKILGNERNYKDKIKENNETKNTTGHFDFKKLFQQVLNLTIWNLKEIQRSSHDKNDQ